METRDISQAIKQFLEREYPAEDGELRDDSPLLEGCFTDSSAIVDTVLFLERQFSINLSRADINGENFKDIRSLTALVEKHVSAA